MVLDSDVLFAFGNFQFMPSTINNYAMIIIKINLLT